MPTQLSRSRTRSILARPRAHSPSPELASATWRSRLPLADRPLGAPSTALSTVLSTTLLAALLAALLAVLLANAGWARVPAADETPASAGESEPASDDPVIRGVLDMLAAEISEPVIGQWLDAAAQAPRLPTPSEMVALRRAGASDELLGRLLALSQAARSDPGAAHGSDRATAAGERQVRVAAPAVSSSSPPSTEPSAEPSAEPSMPAVRASEPARDVVPALSGPIETQFSLSYSPYVLDGDEEWDFYVYLDGEPLSYVPSSGLLGADALVFDLPLEPGPHRLRLSQERHGEARRGPPTHDSRVAETVVAFELEPGASAEVEIVFSQTLLRSKNPISYRIAQGGRVLQIEERTGGDPESWVEPCEDLELSLGEGQPSRSERRRLERCVPWSQLWAEPGAESSESHPTRAQILEALARFDYRPTPKNQRLR